MIFVTVGNAHNPFVRLVEAADEAAPRLDEEVVIQSGHTLYQARHARQIAFLSLPEYDELIQAARLVVAHAGSGSIISALQCGKPLVVMPRLARYGEHVNDHQLEIADALAREGRLRRVDSREELIDVLAAPVNELAERRLGCPPLLSALDNWLQCHWATDRHAVARQP